MPAAAPITMKRRLTPIAPRSPSQRPNKPEIREPKSGAKTAMAKITVSALHQINILDRDRTAVAEVGDDNGETDRRLGGGDRQHEHGKDLAGEIAQRAREGDQVEVDGEQHELDRHHDGDDVLAVHEDAEDANDQQDGGHD